MKKIHSILLSSANLAALGPLPPDLEALLPDVWHRWTGLLEQVQSHGVAAIWLPEAVEEEIDAAMAASPAKGVVLDKLAAELVQAAMGRIVPGVAELGCAPLPDAQTLATALAQCGDLAVTSSGTLTRRYAVATFAPFQGGCQACAFVAACPGLPKRNKEP
jgi:hypothetical protein